MYKLDLMAVHMPVIPALGKLRQEAKKSEARLGGTAQFFFSNHRQTNK